MPFVKGKIVLDLTAENVVLENDFVIGISWPTDSSFADPSTIIMIQSHDGRSFTRNLYSPDYGWFVMQGINGKVANGPLHTIYAAELERLDQ